jgi:hypothetical protein
VTPAALRAACGTSLSGIDQGRLLDARDALYVRGETLKGPAATAPISDPAARLFLAAGVETKNARGLPRFVVESKCHSLWIATKDGRNRVTYFLGIHDESIRDHPRSAAFVW